MHRSATETKRLAVCLFLSALLHLAVVLLTPSTPDPQPALQVVFRPPPRTLETRAFDPTRPALSERQMQRLVVESALPQIAQEPTESVSLGEIAEQLPPEVHADMAHLEKRLRIERSGDVNIDSLLLAHMAAEEDFREDYARFPLANMGADRDRALEVVERAIEAMGGRKRLLAIRAMSAMVWIEANLKELERPLLARWCCPNGDFGDPLSVSSGDLALRGIGRSRCLYKRKIQGRGFVRPCGPQPVLCEQKSQATAEDIRGAL